MNNSMRRSNTAASLLSGLQEPSPASETLVRRKSEMRAALRVLDWLDDGEEPTLRMRADEIAAILATGEAQS